MAGTNTKETGRGSMSYGDFVASLAKDGDTIKQELTGNECHMMHMIMGISGEAGELLDAVKKSIIYRKQLDMENVLEELGDIEFFLEGFRQCVGLTREETVNHNMSKLSKRYAKLEYTDTAAQTRADKQ